MPLPTSSSSSSIPAASKKEPTGDSSRRTRGSTHDGSRRGSAAQNQSEADASQSTFKFLVTTDNHLGFQEKDARRGEDSFTTFEECLRAARVEHDVDAMLLGGDLFHENKPSLSCLTRTCSLFRKYVFGDRSVDFSLLSDPHRNFPTHAIPCANFQDSNVNIALPVFIIHGNHDDPIGGTSAIDILSSNSLVNYFGHVSSLEDIVVEPILLRKGTTHVALYGLGNVRDERLHRCFRLKKIQFIKPKPQNGVRWFNILLVHQNRGIRAGFSNGSAGHTGVGPSYTGSGGNKAGILEGMLAGHDIHLVVWGNEHEQLLMPQAYDGFDVVQPGSTIRTSLSGTESNPKQYGVLEIRDRSYRLTPFTLRSVRPYVRRVVELWREPRLRSIRTIEAVEDFLRGVVETMIEDAEDQLQLIPDDVLNFHPNIKFPLLRLCVDFTDPDSVPFPQPNINRFGQQYMEVCVNPGDLLRPVKPKRVSSTGGGGADSARSGDVGVGDLGSGTDAGGGMVVPAMPQLHTRDIRTKIADVFNTNAKDACTLLSEPEVAAAVYTFVEKGERDAIDEKIRELLLQCQKYVWKSVSKKCTEEKCNLDVVMSAEKITEVALQHKQDMNRAYVELLATEESGNIDKGRAADQRKGNFESHTTIQHLQGTARTAAAAATTAYDDDDDVTALISRHHSVLDEVNGPADTDTKSDVAQILTSSHLARQAFGESDGSRRMKRPRADDVDSDGDKGDNADLDEMFTAVPHSFDDKNASSASPYMRNGGGGDDDDVGYGRGNANQDGDDGDDVCFVGSSQKPSGPRNTKRGGAGRTNTRGKGNKASGAGVPPPPRLQLTAKTVPVSNSNHYTSAPSKANINSNPMKDVLGKWMGNSSGSSRSASAAGQNN